jgi:hypothetical protein
MNYTLNMFNTGQVTLPKKWRSQYWTKKFSAQEKNGSLVITPIIPDNDWTTYYESEDGSFGIYNENWIDVEKLFAAIKELDG